MYWLIQNESEGERERKRERTDGRLLFNHPHNDRRHLCVILMTSYNKGVQCCGIRNVSLAVKVCKGREGGVALPWC